MLTCYFIHKLEHIQIKMYILRSFALQFTFANLSDLISSYMNMSDVRSTNVLAHRSLFNPYSCYTNIFINYLPDSFTIFFPTQIILQWQTLDQQFLILLYSKSYTCFKTATVCPLITENIKKNMMTTKDWIIHLSACCLLL